ARNLAHQKSSADVASRRRCFPMPVSIMLLIAEGVFDGISNTNVHIERDSARRQEKLHLHWFSKMIVWDLIPSKKLICSSYTVFAQSKIAPCPWGKRRKPAGKLQEKKTAGLVFSRIHFRVPGFETCTLPQPFAI